MESFDEDQLSTLEPAAEGGPEASALTEGMDDNSTRVVPSSKIDIQEQRLSISEISKKMVNLIERVNRSRSSDMTMIDSFQEQIITKITETCQVMKSHLCAIYEANSMKMQPKLQELSEMLENCSKLINELLEVNEELGDLRQICLCTGEIAEPK